MNRKQRRTLNKIAGKKATSTIDLMLSLPDECQSCHKPYDKKDLQMAQTWFVEVYNSQKRTVLTCLSCYEDRKNATNTIR